jgi:hypothetical protein
MALRRQRSRRHAHCRHHRGAAGSRFRPLATDRCRRDAKDVGNLVECEIPKIRFDDLRLPWIALGQVPAPRVPRRRKEDRRTFFQQPLRQRTDPSAVDSSWLAP